MKHISTVTILALCAVIPANAKQVGKKTAPVQQPQPAPITYVQPQPRPQPRPQQPPIVQIETGPTYTEIYTSLTKKQPDSSDFSMLRNIKNEAERQIKQIQEAVQQPKPTGMKDYAEKLVKEYYKPFEIKQATVENAVKNDSDIFSEKTANEHREALQQVVRLFATQFRVDKDLTKKFIYEAIINFPSMATLVEQIRKTPNSNKYAAMFRNDIENAILEALNTKNL